MFRLLYYILMTGMLLMAGCRDSSTPPEEGEGLLRILIQDDLIDYSSVVISIDSVAILQIGTPLGWNYLNTEPEPYDLTSFRNGTMGVLAQSSFGPGYVDSVRLHFHPVELTDNGIVSDLVFTNGATGDFRQNAMTRISVDSISEIIITVDLYHSIIYDQQSETYRFDPHIEAVNTSIASVIKGTIAPQADIYLWPVNDTSETRYTRSFFTTGVFGFYGIRPGAYDIYCIPTPVYAADYDTLKNENQIIVLGQEFDMGSLTLPPR